MNYEVVGEGPGGERHKLPVIVVDKSSLGTLGLVRIVVGMPSTNRPPLDGERRDQRRFSANPTPVTGFGEPDGPL